MYVDNLLTAELEGDHQRIMRSLSVLATMVDGPHDPAVARRVLSVILDDMEAHCRREELIAGEMRLAEGVVETLKREHGWVMAEYEGVREAIRSPAGGNERQLIEWLVEVTVAHIAGVDAPIFARRRPILHPDG